MLRQSIQRQSITCPFLTAFLYCCREIPLLHVLCCHRSHPSHWMPSCLARTGSLQRMHKSWFTIINESWKCSVVNQSPTKSEWKYLDFHAFYMQCVLFSAKRQTKDCVGWSSCKRWLMLHACIFSHWEQQLTPKKDKVPDIQRCNLVYEFTCLGCVELYICLR